MDPDSSCCNRNQFGDPKIKLCHGMFCGKTDSYIWLLPLLFMNTPVGSLPVLHLFFHEKTAKDIDGINQR